MSETDITRAIMLGTSHGEQRLWRNNVGVLQDSRGNHVRYGLAVGSPDLIGLQCVTIGPEHVGRRLAVFVGIEVKDERGKLSESQSLFLDMLRSLHAYHGVARSVDDARRILTLTPDYP